MKTNIILLSVVTLLCISCKKNVNEPGPIQINFSKEALTYVYMPPNKYYIYKDSATGETDSVMVTQSEVDRILAPAQTYNILGFPGHQPAFYYQSFSLLLSKINGSSSSDWFYGIAKANLGYFSSSNTDSAGLMLLERNRSANADKLYVFNSFSLASGFGNTVFPSLTIEGKVYSDVIRVTNNNGYTPSISGYSQFYLATIYYWAKGIGIIKRSLITASSTKTWTLVRNG